MTHEEAFLQDILENREDDTPRRVFADWLLDQGDEVNAARGEFIHLQCELAKVPLPARPAPLVRRERELLEAHGREWGSRFGRLGCTCWEYRRGFVEGVGISAHILLSQAAALFRAAPIRELKLYNSSGWWRNLAGCVHLGRVQSLDLEKNDLDDADLEVLAGATHLGELGTLLLWSNRIGDAGLRQLLGAALPRLTRLDLSSNLISDAGARALAGSALLGRLRLLDLTGNQVTDTGASALIESPRAAALGWLELAKNPISMAMQCILRDRFAARVPGMG
jgi:uncharacterized protein (TIGR02996 family)